MSMFYVKHHDDEVTILNSKCPTAILMDRLRTLAGLPPEHGVDLMPHSGTSDHKNPQPLQMHERIEANGSAIYANTFVASRGTYVLLSANEDEEGVRALKPVWTSANKDESDKLASMLESRAADERKKLASKKNKK